jgi:acetyl esterase
MHAMPIDPQIAALFANAPEWPPTRSQPIPQLREAVRASSTAFPKLEVPLASIVDRTVPGPAGEIPVRVYTPTGSGPFPLISYFHGGGYVTGNLDTQDMIARALAFGAGAVVVSVDYRLAPENPFPAGPDDCWAATQWVAAHAAELNGDAGRLAVAGDSAGANLAAGVALRARDAGGPRIAAQIMFYGSCDHPSTETPASREFADGPILSADDVAYFWELYLSQSRHRAERSARLAGPRRGSSQSCAGLHGYRGDRSLARSRRGLYSQAGGRWREHEAGALPGHDPRLRVVARRDPGRTAGHRRRLRLPGRPLARALSASGFTTITRPSMNMPQTLKLSATAQTAALPITDHASLRAALRDADVPTLLMVLTHFERDEALLDSFAPYIGSIFDVPKEIPEPMLTQLRERLFRVLTTARPGTDTSVEATR